MRPTVFVSFKQFASSTDTDALENFNRDGPWGRRFLCAVTVAIAAIAASLSFAATTTLSTLIDADNNLATGCSINTVNGAFTGVDRVLNTVVTTDTAGYRVSSITLQSCVSGALGPATIIDASASPLARGNGANGTTAVETYVPNAFVQGSGQKMRIGITTLGGNGLSGADALTVGANGPILVDGPPLLVVPTMARISLALTALLLAISVWYARRRGWHGLQLVVVAAFAISMSGQLIAAIARDGFVGDWSGIAPAATDPAGDAPAGTDITNLYSTVDNGNVYFRIDTALNAPPVANAQSVVAVAGQSLPITLTGSDLENSPLTFSVVTPPTQGVLGGSGANITYTQNAAAAAADSFTFKANDGSLDSAVATVLITNTRAPAITSVNNALFVPTQANSFTVLANGLPTPTASFGGCTPALPATITFAPNASGGGVLAGNPTPAQAGVYACTVGASNGVLPNASQSFTLTVGGAPTITSAAALSVPEAAVFTHTVTTSSLLPITSIASTGALPSGAAFTFAGTPAATASIAGTPAVCSRGTYPVTLSAGNVVTTLSQNFVLTVRPVNQAPSFAKGADITALEDAPAQTITGWATALNAGAACESAQTLSFEVTANTNAALFSVAPAVNGTNGNLTFTPAPNANGTATITLRIKDNGGTADGGVDTSATQSFAINITAVNDAPSFTKGANQTVLQNAGAQTVANWATAISAGPADEAAQTLTFTATNTNNALFSAQPAIAANGTLTYTPATNANGVATVSVTLKDSGGTANGGVDTSAAQTFTITVTSVNQVPSFTPGPAVTVLEDATPYSQAWATAISPGPANESSQLVNFIVTNTNNALFSVQPAISATGVLSFTVSANANGSATVSVAIHDDGGTANGGVDTSAVQTFAINVTAVNDAPSFTKGPNIAVFENSGAFTQAGWATALSAGPADESGQTLSFFIASNTNPGLFSAGPAVSPTGGLSFTPIAGQSGVATVGVQIKDSGGTANGGVDTSATQTFTITVTGINHAPSFTKGADQTVLEDSGVRTVVGWATAISDGDGNSQSLAFQVTNNTNAALFSAGPAIAANGTLTFTPAANANGTATITLNLKDSGGTANSGVDTSATQSFVVNVTAVNDAPSFVKGADQSVASTAGAVSVPAWATSISAGPADESGQTLTFTATNTNNALFSAQPAVAANGTLTYTVAGTSTGTATVSVTLKDNGGTANGGVDTSATLTFAITVTAGTPAKLAFVQQPGNTAAGAAITPAMTVQIQDAGGNLVSSSTANVTLAIANNPGGGALSGTATVAASGGVATFSGLSIDKVGVGYTLIASSGALTAATSTPFNIAVGAAAKLVFVQQPASAASGAAITPAMTVQIQDAAGNLVNSAANVTLAIGTNPGGGTLSGTATVAASGGVATFSGLSIDKAGAGYTLVATSPSLTANTSSAFNITVGTAAKLAFVQQPTSTPSGVAITPAITVQIQDAAGNLVNSAANVTLLIGTNPGGGTLSGTATVAAVGGVATFGGLSIDKTGLGYTLIASSGVLTATTSTAFNVAAGGAAKLAFVQQPSNATSGAAIAPAMTVQIQDAAGNLVNSTANVTLTIGTNPSGGALSGTATVAAVGGVATFSNLSIDKVGVGYTLIASSGALSSATSSAFNVAAGGAAKLAFVQQPTNTTSGAAIAPAMTVQIQDAAGNLVNSTASVTLAIATNPSGGALSGTATVAAVGGVATLGNLSIDKAGAGYTLAASSAPLTSATSASFAVTAGVAAKLAFVQQPTNTTSGAAITPAMTVQIQDAAGNLVNSTASVTLAIGTNPSAGVLSGTATVAAVAGVATFSNLSIDKVGVGYTLIASSGALTSATSSAFNVAAGGAAKLAFVQQPSNATSGAAITPAMTVQIQDAAGNLVNSTANVTLAIGTNPSGGALSGTATVAAAGGVATFSNLSIDKAGVGYTLIASSGALTSATSSAFNVAAGGAAKLAFVQQPTNTTSGAAITPAMTVQIQDAAGNLVNSTANVALAIGTNPSGGALSGTATVAAVAGVATFGNLSIDKAGAGYTLIASSGALTSATSSAFNVAAGGAAKLAFVQQPTNTTSSAAIAPAMTLQIQDAAGNLVNSTANVTLAIGTNPSAGVLSGTGTVAAVGGVATFSNLSIDKVGVGYRLAATSGALTSATSAAFNIAPGAATHFSVVAPASATGAVPFNFTVTALDAANNTATGYVGTVHFTSTDALASLPVDYTFAALDGGVKSRSATLNTNGAQTIAATDTVTTSITGTSNSIAVSTGPSITSANSATFVVGTNSSFTINTTGTPTVNSITLTGCTLQNGLSFTYVSGSTATISGNPSATGVVSCTVTAANGVPPAATQTLTVTVNQAPTISAISNATFSVGVAGSGSFTVTGFPTPTLTLSGCTLPSGLNLVGNQITGTANVGATTVNGCIVTAANGVGSNASTAPFTITITSAPPTVSTSGGTTAFTEPGPAVVVDSGLTVTQPGGTNLASGAVSISGGTFVSGQDVLFFTNQNGITGSYSSGTGLLTLTGSSSLANYQTALRSITYSNTSPNPSIANRTVQFVVNDGSASSTPATKTVSVTAVNDAPVLTTGSTLSYTENGVAAVINSVITVNDADSANLVGATVSVTSGYVNGQDVLSFSNTASITGSFNSASGILTLSGTTTVANYQAALRSVKYSNLSNDPSNGASLTTSRTISYQVDDGSASNNLSNIVTSTVNVTAVNDLPTAIALTGLYAQAGIPISYPAGTLGGTDLEAGTTVTLVTTADSLCSGCQLTINANGSFTFTPPPSAAGTTANFTYHVADTGNPAPGTVSAPVTVSFTVVGPAIYFVKSTGSGTACTLGNECTLATALSGPVIGTTTNARIFINDSSTHSSGATLNSGGWLVGLGATGTFDALFGISPTGTGTLAARPTLGAARPTVQGTVTLNTNSTVRGLNLSTGTSTGLTDPGAAITGVAVSEVSATATTGTAVSLSDTGGVVSLTSVSANGGTNGVVLTNTTGSFTVTGDSTGNCGGAVTNNTTVATAPVTADCTGGTIQNTATGIRLNNAQNVSLTRVRITGTAANNYGIFGTNVTNFTLNRSVIDGSIGASTAAGDAPLVFGVFDTGAGGTNGLSGNSFITDSTISGGIEHNVELYGQSNNYGLTITRSVLKGNNTATGGDGLQMYLQGSAVARVLVDNSQFDDNRSQAIQVSAIDSSTAHFTAQNSRWTRTTQGNEGVLFQNGGGGKVFVDVNGNQVNGFGGAGISVGPVAGNATASSSLDARIRNNTVTSPATATNHSILALMTSTVGQSAPQRVQIDNNTVVHNSTLLGIFVDTPDANTRPNFHATVVNNTASNTNAGSLRVLAVQSRQSAVACIDVANNAATAAGGTAAVRVRQADTAGAAPFATAQLVDRPPTGAASAAAELTANHPGVTTEVLGTVSLTTTACTLPTAPTLP